MLAAFVRLWIVTLAATATAGCGGSGGVTPSLPLQNALGASIGSAPFVSPTPQPMASVYGSIDVN